MLVKLKVLQGSKAGKLLTVQGSQMLIGREEGCDLRPRTELISRKHCLIRVTDSQVSIKDLDSRNGTYVNDKQVEGEHGLKEGDQLRIGPLLFEVVINAAVSEKRPEVKNVAEAVQRTAEDSVGDFDVSSWLQDVDNKERTERLQDPGNRQFKIDETNTLTAQKTTETNDESSVDKDQSTIQETTPNKKPEKEEQKFGKLPKVPKQLPKDSREAAQNMLKKFFSKG